MAARSVTYSHAWTRYHGPRAIRLDRVSWWHIRQRFTEGIAIGLGTFGAGLGVRVLLAWLFGW